MGKKWGDRRDGALIRKIDAMHYLMPLMYPNRCDNEAFISEQIDLTNINAYLEKKNASGPVYKYNFFQIMVTAILKTITLRPKMNRFIVNYHMYQRNEVSAAFTIKKIFTDEGDEALAFIHSKETDTIDTIHEELYRQISYCKGDGKDQSSESMDMISKIPRFLKKTVGRVARFLDRHGWMPQSVIETDPYQSSVVLSNLGSLKLKAAYHHLTNWGTTSVFCTIGEIKNRKIETENGEEERPVVPIGLIIDERIADGYYYAKTIRLLKTLLQNPELLEKPLGEAVEY